MADIADQHDQTSPTELDDGHAVGNGSAVQESRGVKRQRPSAADDEDDDDEKGSRERRKIEIKFISDKSRRHITFSKRKAGIMKKVRPSPRRDSITPVSTPNPITASVPNLMHPPFLIETLAGCAPAVSRRTGSSVLFSRNETKRNPSISLR